MTLQAGTRIGAYEVLGPLGTGGMGEVYRAHDPKLRRDVAMKVLPSAFARDPDRLARFRREAHVLATLNHPHIAAIYGFEEIPDVHALVLELVEGPTLAERVARGPLPIAEALNIAAQIADALDAAHEKGIVHRDLKPANIKLTTDDRVKVLDFGLAKALADDSQADASASPTMTAMASRLGVIVGTAAYMSPEQAKGKAVDKRTDIWAFGCVLYEMLTGGRVFAGEGVADFIVSVLTKDPDWTLLPAGTPTRVVELLKRCLRKDPRERLRDIGDARIELEEALAGARHMRADAQAATGTGTPLWKVVAVLAVMTAAGMAAWMFSHRGAEPAAALTRTTALLPAGQELDAVQTTAPLALSADGRRLGYVASSGGRTLLYLRGLDAFDAKAIEGTDGARFPFFSPDGQSIAFFADGKLKRVSISGGTPTVICDVPVPGRGATWGPDGTIVFTTVQFRLMRVSASGGQPAPVVSHDPAMDARLHSWPLFLPDGRGLISTVQETLGGASSLAALSLQTGEWHPLVPGSQAQYLSNGYLVYHAAQVREGQVEAVAFDIDALAARGSPVPVLDGAFRSANGGAAFFAVSPTGTLIFAPGGFARTLVRVDRQGRRSPLVEERRGFRFPRFSPDGRRVVVTVDPRPSQIWVYDVERGSRLPIATQGHNLTPIWTPDGQRVVFSGRTGILWAAADGSSPAAQLLSATQPDASNVNPTSWTPDGRVLVFQQQIPATDFDIWVAPTGEKPRMIVSTSARDLDGRLSPDGRWLAYYSNESGRHEVYVRPFPSVNEHKWAISTTGGWTPVWAPDGHELYLMDGSSLMAVPVKIQGSSFIAGKPELLFDGPFDTTQDMNFDVSPDGKYFLMVEADPDAKRTKVNVVLNWGAEVQRVVPGH